MEDLHAKHASTELNRIFDEKFGAYMQQVNDGEAPMLSPWMSHYGIAMRCYAMTRRVPWLATTRMAQCTC